MTVKQMCSVTVFLAAVLMASGCSGKAWSVEDFHGRWKGEGIELTLDPVKGSGVEIRTPQNNIHVTGAKVAKDGDNFVISFMSPARDWKATLSDDGNTLQLVATDDGEKRTLTRQK
jgi:hypothetical protein